MSYAGWFKPNNLEFVIKSLMEPYGICTILMINTTSDKDYDMIIMFFFYFNITSKLILPATSKMPLTTTKILVILLE